MRRRQLDAPPIAPPPHLLAKLRLFRLAERGQLLGMGGDALDGVERILPGGAQGAAQPVGRPLLEHAGFAKPVDHQIRQRGPAGAGAGDAEQRSTVRSMETVVCRSMKACTPRAALRASSRARATADGSTKSWAMGGAASTPMQRLSQG